jgi:hypothetical protein
MARAQVDALFVADDPMFFTSRTRLVELAAKSRLPTTFAHRDFVTAGGLMSYGPSLSERFRLAATYVDKILKGAKPADLPVEQAAKLECVINPKTAKALGLTIRPALLFQATEVIQEACGAHRGKAQSDAGTLPNKHVWVTADSLAPASLRPSAGPDAWHQACWWLCRCWRR